MKINERVAVLEAKVELNQDSISNLQQEVKKERHSLKNNLQVHESRISVIERDIEVINEGLKALKDLASSMNIDLGREISKLNAIKYKLVGGIAVVMAIITLLGKYIKF